MKEWVYIDGYQGKKIVNPDTVDLNELNTDEEIIRAYCELMTASHHRSSEKLGNAAWRKGVELADKVREIFEKKGWHAHIFKTGSCDCDCHRDLYLHATGGSIQIHQVPFSEKWNIDLNPDELFDHEGNVLSMDIGLEKLRSRIGEEGLNIDDMALAGHIELDAINIIKKIMAAECLKEVHAVEEDGRTFRSGAKEFTWRKDEEEAEQEAREELMDGEIWKMMVAEGRTEMGLEEWVDAVLSTDGWEASLCRYDGQGYTLDDGTVYWRSN